QCFTRSVHPATCSPNPSPHPNSQPTNVGSDLNDQYIDFNGGDGNFRLDPTDESSTSQGSISPEPFDQNTTAEWSQLFGGGTEIMGNIDDMLVANNELATNNAWLFNQHQEQGTDPTLQQFATNNIAQGEIPLSPISPPQMQKTTSNLPQPIMLMDPNGQPRQPHPSLIVRTHTPEPYTATVPLSPFERRDEDMTFNVPRHRRRSLSLSSVPPKPTHPIFNTQPLNPSPLATQSASASSRSYTSSPSTSIDDQSLRSNRKPRPVPPVNRAQGGIKALFLGSGPRSPKTSPMSEGAGIQRPMSAQNRPTPQMVGVSSNQFMSPSSRQAGPSSLPNTVDHHQRLNELQARFKVKLDRKSVRGPPLGNHLLSASYSAPTDAAGMRPQPSTSMQYPSAAPSVIHSPFGQTSELLERSMAMNVDEAPPMRHLRKRSISLPPNLPPNFLVQTARDTRTLGFVTPENLSAPSTPSMPVNMTLPIQIQRAHKSHHLNSPMNTEEHQRRLDEQLEKVDFEDITVTELKDMLRQRGKPATGKKAVLLQRLQEEMDFVKAMKHNYHQLQQQQSSNNASSSQALPQPHGTSSPTVGSPSTSLQRSIANLQISSPPMHSRRFSPYGAPSSPRLTASFSGHPHSYSTSLPMTHPHNLNAEEMMSNPLASNSMIIPGTPPVVANAPGSPFTHSGIPTPEQMTDYDVFSSSFQSALGQPAGGIQSPIPVINRGNHNGQQQINIGNGIGMLSSSAPVSLQQQHEQIAAILQQQHRAQAQMQHQQGYGDMTMNSLLGNGDPEEFLKFEPNQLSPNSSNTDISMMFAGDTNGSMSANAHVKQEDIESFLRWPQ
ncbi:hypothetical protein BC938DRAFT_475823, partial [Jimgerdemannia flammicorona]